MELTNFANFANVLEALLNANDSETFRYFKRILNRFVDFANYMDGANKDCMKIVREYKYFLPEINALGTELGVY